MDPQEIRNQEQNPAAAVSSTAVVHKDSYDLKDVREEDQATQESNFVPPQNFKDHLETIILHSEKHKEKQADQDEALKQQRQKKAAQEANQLLIEAVKVEKPKDNFVIKFEEDSSSDDGENMDRKRKVENHYLSLSQLKEKEMRPKLKDIHQGGRPDKV